MQLHAGGSRCNEFLSTVSHPIWETALVYASCMRHVVPATLNTWAHRKRRYMVRTLPLPYMGGFVCISQGNIVHG